MAFFGGSRYSRQFSITFTRGLPPAMERIFMRQMGDDLLVICAQLLPFRGITSRKGEPPYSKSGTLVSSLDYRVSGNRLIVYMVSYGRALHEGLDRPFIEQAFERLRPRVPINLLTSWDDASSADPSFGSRFSVLDLLGFVSRALAYLDRTF